MSWYDVMMANASKKKAQSPSKLSKPKESSPRKRKSPESNSALLNGDSLPPIPEHQENVENSSSWCQNTDDGLKITESDNADAEKGLMALKKPKVSMSPNESVMDRAGYWGVGKRVPFIFLAKTLDAISKKSCRITETMCSMLRTVMETTPDDLLAVVYLLANRISDEDLELGIRRSSFHKALAEVCGAKEAYIKQKCKDLGDLGLVAKAIRSSQPLLCKPKALTVAKVLDTFRLIAKESGKDSQEKKKNHIKALLVAATDCEPQYLIRLLQSNLRIGLAEQTLLAALGHAAVYREKHSTPARAENYLDDAAKIVKEAYSVNPIYGKIVPVLISGGVWDLQKICMVSPGIPVGPMLAKPINEVSRTVEKFKDMEFTCEYKYDGERAQIHYLEDGSVEIYSRNAERSTRKFPDVAAAVTGFKKSSVTSFILDCELVAYDRQKQKILPFQILNTRARKNVRVDKIKVNVCIFAFDILYINGQNLLQEQLTVRREKLYNSFQEKRGFFQFATYIISNDLEEIQKFLNDAVNSRSEGLIIKTLKKNATYEPSKRSNNWLKLKKDYMETFGDSLDLVPIAAFHGSGKRTGVYGAFLLACYDNDKEEFQSICKTGTGFSEAMLKQLSRSLSSKIITVPKSNYRCSDTISPDVWFEPSEVWEVKAADLTISPLHCAAIGIVDHDKGISLRFPRLLRVRKDKNPEQASSSDQIADMYNAQEHTKKYNKDENEDNCYQTKECIPA